MKKVGVCPPELEASHRRLFNALAEAYPVTFTARQPDEFAELDALILFPVVNASMLSTAPPELPKLIICNPPVEHAHTGEVQFTDSNELDSRLRGRKLNDCQAHGQTPLNITPEDTVLAEADGHPLWAIKNTGEFTIHRTAVNPPPLVPNVVLRERLCNGDFISLLPLVQFLREVCHTETYTPPPPRAAFLFDDPNLRGSSYGHLRFPELIAHAQEFNYHAAIATVPLDAWFSRKKAVELFRNNPQQLSLLYHGNDHLSGELARPMSESDAQKLLAQARRRMGKLEKRTDLFVDHVMAAPHGLCSESMMQQMPRLGFEAACISRPYPWLERPPSEKLLAQWPVTDIVAGCLPIIPRYKITKPREDLVWRAYLNQPMIVYGHHEDLAGGLDILAQTADLINSLGEVQWLSLGAIAQSNYAVRREGSILHVRPYSRRMVFEDLTGIEKIVIHAENGFSEALGGDDLEISVEESPRIEFSIGQPSPLDHTGIPSPPMRIWPFVRRILTESRDRLAPLLGK